MIKSEWSPIKSSKKDVKRRLDSLFGEYSHFAVKPDQQLKQHNQLNKDENDKSAPSPCSNIENELENHYTKFEKDNAKSPEKCIREHPRSNLDSLIGEIGVLVNVSKPLSPVSFQNTPIKTEVTVTESHETEIPPKNNETKLTLDLDIILEQISRVSPLLSPINLEMQKEHRKKQIEAEQSKISRKRQNDTVESNNDHIKFVRLESGKCTDQNITRKESHSLHYSIKLNEETFQKLLQRINQSFEIANHQNKRPANSNEHIKNARNSKQLDTENDCIKWARRLFDTLYHDQIVDLPEQLTLQGKIPSNVSGFPQPLHFNINEERHLDFVHSASILRAQLYGIIEPIMDRQRVAQIAASYNSSSSE